MERTTSKNNGKPMNQKWSMDNPSIRKQERAGTTNPEEGLNTRKDDVLGIDEYQDPEKDRT